MYVCQIFVVARNSLNNENNISNSNESNNNKIYCYFFA